MRTGYSDLDAIEGAMNDGEVFRFLSKPCAANELRGTISQAAAIARETGQVAQSAAQTYEEESNTQEMLRLSEEAVVPDLELAVDVATRAAAPVAPSTAPAPAPQPEPVDATTALLDEMAPAARPAGTPAPAPKPATPKPPAQTRPVAQPRPAPQAPPPAPPANQPAALRNLSGEEAPIEIVMSGDTYTVSDSDAPAAEPPVRAAPSARPAPVLQPHETPASPPRVPTLRPPSRVACVGKGKYKISVIVFTQDDQFARSIGRSLDGLFYTFHATNAVRLVEGVANIGPAVVITDVSTEPEVIQSLTGLLKDKLPALVTMVAGKHRDADVMINLINHGQVFRFIDKPLSSTSAQKHVREALRRHIQLRKNPELIQRYAVRDSSGLAGTIARLGDRISGSLLRIRKLWGG